MLGRREPEHYGSRTLDDINELLVDLATSQGHHLDCFQSNSEAAIIDRIHQSMDDGTQFTIINPAGFTHSSVALRDALMAVAIPFVEIHLSNIHQREAFRHHSYFSDVALGVICGFGAQGYEFALQAALAHLEENG